MLTIILNRFPLSRLIGATIFSSFVRVIWLSPPENVTNVPAAIEVYEYFHKRYVLFHIQLRYKFDIDNITKYILCKRFRHVSM